MPRYEVTAWVGSLSVEVEADDEDSALDAADDAWDLHEILSDATYEVREVGEDAS